MLHRLTTYFLRGLFILTPIVVTVYVAFVVFATVDSWINVETLLDRRIPGAGFVITLTLITLTGFLASNFMTRWVFHLADRVFGRVPLFKLLYSSLKDLTGAFVGDRKRFDRPVLVRPTERADVLLFGFQTRDELGEFGLADHGAVYVPQSYNFAGNLIVVPRSRIQPLNVDGVAAMTFIVSGGVSGKTRRSAGS